MCFSSRDQIENSEEYLYKLLSINTDEYLKLSNEVFPNSNNNNIIIITSNTNIE